MDQTQIMLLSRKLKEIKKYRGEGTQLISLYLPLKVDRSSVTKQLTDEISQSSNIKSQSTRKNVQAALRRITTYLKDIDFKLPETGLVLFAGNVSENPSKIDVILLQMIPPRALTTKLYWCDSEFHTAPLEEMLLTDEIYGIVAVDNSESTIAILTGKSYKVIDKLISGVFGKFRAGGQCLSKDSQILLSDGNLVSIDKLNTKMQVKSINLNSKDYNQKDSMILNKWNTTKDKVYKIITKEPRFEIESSGDHVFFVYNGESIIERCAEDLKTNDILIMPEKVNVLGKLQNLNSKKYYNSFTITKEGADLLIKKRLNKKLLQKQLADKLDLTPTTISSYEIGKININREVLKKLCNYLEIDYLKFLKNYTKETIFTNINLPNILDSLFAQFLGYYAGDGNWEEDRITFSENNKDVALSYKERFDKYFAINSSLRFRENKNYYQLRFTSRPLVRLISEEFFEIKKAKDTIIPSKILCSKPIVIAGFLKGLFDAEGYVSKSRKSIGFAVNNKILAQQIQLTLLRFSILSSFNEYDNRRNPYTKNHRFTIDITEKKSLEIFKEKIGFTSAKKSELLNLILKTKSNMERSRQILVSGKIIREIIEDCGHNINEFPKVSGFFQNKRMIGKTTFATSILNNIKDKKLYSKLKEIYNYNILPVKISNIKISKKKTELIDLSIKDKNFIANGILVHNSAHRFERQREEFLKQFYIKIGERLNSAFADSDKLKGIIVGGPGHTKFAFIEDGELDSRLKKKILGTVDTCYTDESGIKEILDKGEELLKEASIVKERNFVNKFIEYLVKRNLATYGFNETIDAINLAKADLVLISAGIEWKIVKYNCTSCGKIIPQVIKNIIKRSENASEINCPVCNSKCELIEEVDLFDYFVDLAVSTGAKVELISIETVEGKQFFETFAGIGATLRY
ncbi:MAG: LAGLIDADG family homing endonuclease [archaeon]